MFTKNVLKAFDPDTPIRVCINERQIEDLRTVRDFMASGLMTYNTTEAGSLRIENDTIIINIE